MIGTPVVALDRQMLEQMANPQASQGGESIPFVLFDTQTFTSASTTELNYFVTSSTDPTITNMQGPGVLPDPWFLQIFNLGYDVIIDGTTQAGTETGALDDVAKIMMVGRPVFTLTISDKKYGQYPLSFLHTSGGAYGVGYGTFTAEESIQFATNSVPDGGWNWYGSVIIPPRVGFSVNVRWAAAQTLQGGNPPTRFWMSGILHRRVL